MKNTFWFVLIAFSLFGCMNDDGGDCGEFTPAPLYINLELIDSITNENLLTNQTLIYENLSLEAQNNNSFLMQKTANDQLLISFDYNNASGIYFLKNNGTALFQIVVTTEQEEIGCYLHNKIKNVDFPGQNYESSSEQQLYRIKL